MRCHIWSELTCQPNLFYWIIVQLWKILKSCLSQIPNLLFDPVAALLCVTRLVLHHTFNSGKPFHSVMNLCGNSVLQINRLKIAHLLTTESKITNEKISFQQETFNNGSALISSRRWVSIYLVYPDQAAQERKKNTQTIRNHIEIGTSYGNTVQVNISHCGKRNSKEWLTVQ